MAFTKLLSVEDNTAPPVVLTLERDNGDGTTSAIDVSGSGVDLIINLDGTITNTGHQACALTTPTSGIVTYTTATADFATPGTYNCEVKITYGNGTIETLYEKFQVKARPKLS